MCITISIMLEKLRLFLVVLEEGSLRRAADRLRISQSAITRQMQSLEFDPVGAFWNEHRPGCVPRTEDMPLPKGQKRFWQIMILPWLRSAG
jgi:Bacterial regulatory helix-turn-helix protein, lysR family